MLDSSENILVAGRTKNLGAGGYDAILIKYNSSGDQLYNRTWGGILDDYGNDLAIDNEGNVYMAGETSNFGAVGKDVFITIFGHSFSSNQDFIGPTVSNVVAAPDPLEKGDTVFITCNATDASGIFNATANIQYPDGTTIASLPMSLIGGTGYQTNYSTSSGNALGMYFIDIVACDNSPSRNPTNFNNADSFVLQDTVVPTIISISADPDTLEKGETLTITCNVSDISGIFNVIAYIQYSNGTVIATLPMSIFGGTGYRITWNTGVLTLIDTYYIDINATDNSPSHNAQSINNGDTFQLDDNTPPYNILISINSGDESTNNSMVTLTLHADDVSSMCFRNELGSWSSWEPYASTKSWQLSTDNGNKTVWVIFRDGAMNNASAIADSIVLMSTNAAFLNHTGQIVINLITELGIYIEINVSGLGFIEILIQSFVFSGLSNPTDFTAFFFYSFNLYDLDYDLNESIFVSAKIRMYFNNTSVNQIQNLAVLKYITGFGWNRTTANVNITQHYIEFVTTSFSYYVMGETSTSEQGDDDTEGDGENGEETNYVIIIIIIIVIGSAVAVSSGSAYLVRKNKVQKVAKSPTQKKGIDEKVLDPEAAMKKRELLMASDTKVLAETPQATIKPLESKDLTKNAPAKEISAEKTKKQIVLKKQTASISKDLVKDIPEKGLLKQAIEPKKTKEAKALKKEKVKEKEPEEITEKEKEELKKTEAEVDVETKKFTCVVHRGTITGNVYICPSCQSIYCYRCAKVLKIKGEPCWSCNKEIDISITDKDKLEYLEKRAIDLVGDIIDENPALKEYVQTNKLSSDISNLKEYIFSIISSETFDKIDLLNLTIEQKKNFILELINLNPEERKYLIEEMLKEK